MVRSSKVNKGNLVGRISEADKRALADLKQGEPILWAMVMGHGSRSNIAAALGRTISGVEEDIEALRTAGYIQLFNGQQHSPVYKFNRHCKDREYMEEILRLRGVVRGK